MKVDEVKIWMNCTKCGHKNKLIIKADEKLFEKLKVKKRRPKF